MVSAAVVSWMVAGLAVALGALTEWWHGLRVRRLAYLSFPGRGRPRAWVYGAAPLRVLALGALSWGLFVLWQLAPASQGPADASKRPARHHLVIALDVSPSMHLADAGPAGTLPRRERASALLRSVIDRLDMTETRVSVVAFYSEARPIVIDTFDPEVVRNILDDLPMEHAFPAARTDLYSGVSRAFETARSWSPGSATLIVVSDGDTLPGSRVPRPPPAFSGILVLGVGNPHRGLYIDGHSSRQNRQSLNRLALRLGGMYHDGNEFHVPTGTLSTLAASLPVLETGGWTPREWALGAVAAGSLILAALPLCLSLLGSPRTGRRREKGSPDAQGTLDRMAAPSRGGSGVSLRSGAAAPRPG